MKKIVLKIGVLSFSLLIIYFTIFLIQNFTNKKALAKFNSQNIGEANDTLIRCNWDIKQPEYAYVFYDYEGNISFDKINKVFWSAEDWKTSSIGGTTIKNTTFDELVAMVKEDCSQFQKGAIKGEMEWIYSPAKTSEEISSDKIKRLEDRFSAYGDETKKAFIEAYGDTDKMSDQEKIALYDRIDNEGLEPSVDKTWQVDIFLEDLHYLTQSQRDTIRSQYGVWEGVSHEKIFEWASRMKRDIETGKFSLDDY